MCVFANEISNGCLFFFILSLKKKCRSTALIHPYVIIVAKLYNNKKKRISRKSALMLMICENEYIVSIYDMVYFYDWYV